MFAHYGEDLGALYQAPEDERYAFLFAQCIQLLIQDSDFNRGLPDAFRSVAKRYHAADPAAREHLSEPANRHFMLCDLHDFIRLKAYSAKRRSD